MIFFNKKGILIGYMGENAFGAYIFHTFGILIVVTLITPLNLGHYISFIIVSIVSIIVAFIGGSYIQRLIRSLSINFYY